MLNRIFALALFLAPLLCLAENTNKLQWRNARELTIEGKGWTDTATFYDRIPARSKGVVRAPIWTLSQDSAGMCVRFVTDASQISARWILRKESLGLPNMSASGVSGVDLYVKEKGKWQWIGAGRPAHFSTNESVIVSSVQLGEREYCLYLPLYNGVKEVEVGVSTGAKLTAAPVRAQKPIVFYGTSILQGASASRPGLAYPAIIGRHLDQPTINLGFSGNAHCEPEIARLLAELDPAVYVLDPVPNMTGEMVTENFEKLVKVIREARPETPIVIVEHMRYADAPFVQKRAEKYSGANKALQAAYKNLRKAGMEKLSYIEGEDLTGTDGEATVDGTHPTDVGFARMVAKIEPVVKKALK